MTSSQLGTCTVHFPEWYDERGEWEAESKGWLQGVIVELPNGERHSTLFYDPVRLAQDWDAESLPYLAEPGLIVIRDVTRSAILETAEALYRDGFFEHFKPIPQLSDAAHSLSGAAEK